MRPFQGVTVVFV